MRDFITIVTKLSKVVSAHLEHDPKTAAEYFEETAKLNEIYKEFFAKAPSYCWEVVEGKNFLIIKYSQLNLRKYRFIKDALDKGLTCRETRSMKEQFGNMKFK